MATNPNEVIKNLRPNYDLLLPPLEDESNSRAKVYQAISPGSRVLDVGCDTGRFGEVLQIQKGCIVDGIEADLVAAEIAQSRLNKVFVQCIENETSFDNLANYDAILFLDVLEHLQNPWAVLKGSLKALRSNGTVYVVVPNIAHLSVVRRLVLGQFEYSDYGTMDRTHLRWFTRNSLRKALEEAGLVNVEISGIPSIPYIQGESVLSKFLVKQLVRIFPDQICSSIIGIGKVPKLT